MFDMIAKADHKLLLLNTFHLLLIAFLPFTTAVLAESLHEHTSQHIAAAFYGGILTLIGLLLHRCGITPQAIGIYSSHRLPKNRRAVLDAAI